MAQAAFAIKRNHPRFLFSAEAEAILRDGTSVPAQVLELSARGCYIDALEPVSVGSEVRLRISHGISTCELPAKVIYLHSGYGLGIYGMGVAFGEMASEQQSEVDSWIRELAANQPPKTPN
jgi:hypothetical protein